MMYSAGVAGADVAAGSGVAGIVLRRQVQGRAWRWATRAALDAASRNYFGLLGTAATGLLPLSLLSLE